MKMNSPSGENIFEEMSYREMCIGEIPFDGKSFGENRIKLLLVSHNKKSKQKNRQNGSFQRKVVREKDTAC